MDKHRPRMILPDFRTSSSNDSLSTVVPKAAPRVTSTVMSKVASLLKAQVERQVDLFVLKLAILAPPVVGNFIVVGIYPEFIGILVIISLRRAVHHERLLLANAFEAVIDQIGDLKNHL